MQNFDDAECLTKADIRAAFMKIVGEDRIPAFSSMISVITDTANLAYKMGLCTGYEIAEAEYNKDSQ